MKEFRLVALDSR